MEVLLCVLFSGLVDDKKEFVCSDLDRRKGKFFKEGVVFYYFGYLG